MRGRVRGAVGTVGRRGGLSSINGKSPIVLLIHCSQSSVLPFVLIVLVVENSKAIGRPKLLRLSSNRSCGCLPSGVRISS